MKRQQNSSVLPWALLTIPVLWMGAVLAYGYEDGMNVIELLGRFAVLVERPFSIRWTPHTLKFMFLSLVIYGFALALFFSTKENRRPGEEHGSAKWGDPKQLNAKYRDKDPVKNTLLTQNVRMGLNGKVHRRNLLQIVIGGSGAGKTRFFCKPNLMQANCSFIVTDPKGEMLRAVAPLLLEEGYEIKVFDLIDPERSDSFNPFPYIRDDKDAMKLVNNLIKNTTPKNASNSDPFWEKSEIALDTALILYLLHEAPPEEQNFEMVMYMIENGGAKEDDDDYQSPLDLLFEALEEEDPDHIAVREYKIFKQAAGKTARSILISAAVRLSAFILPQIVSITSRDDMELGMMGDRKQAVFAIIPDNDGTFNYLVGMLYTCAFQALYYQADKVHQGGLPVPVRLMMDEFCNVSLPDDFGKLQATMRSRNIMSTIDIQGQAPDWTDVLAVFAVKLAGADVDGLDVATLDPDRVSKLTAVFLDMTAITTEVETIAHPASGNREAWTEKILHITITPKTADDMRTIYNFTPYQNSALDELLGDRPTLSSLAGSLDITGADEREVLAALPADLEQARRDTVEKALSLVGKVNYFWGGKSHAIGWDDRWGTLRKVTAAGSPSTGTYRPFGLDCSGMIDWALRNAGLPSDGNWYIGTNLTRVSASEARPGDMALFPDASHIGIVVGRNDAGKLLVCHCSSGRNNVVVTEFSATGFTVVGRPNMFD